MPSETEKKQIEARTEELKSDFFHVLSIALGAKNAADGTKTDRRGEIADTLLLRNILTGMTISQALQPVSISGFPKLAVPDFASTLCWLAQFWKQHLQCLVFQFSNMLRKKLICA